MFDEKSSLLNCRSAEPRYGPSARRFRRAAPAAEVADEQQQQPPGRDQRLQHDLHGLCGLYGLDGVGANFKSPPRRRRCSYSDGPGSIVTAEGTTQGQCYRQRYMRPAHHFRVPCDDYSL